MGIWVREQDKQALLMVTYVYICNFGDNDVRIKASIPECTNNYTLAIYSTVERALEVLDLMQQHLQEPCHDKVFVMPAEKENL